MGRPSEVVRAQQKRDLSDKQLGYVIWAATPVGVRVPETAAEFAEVMGVSRTTLWRWERDPKVLDAVRFVVVQNAGDPLRVTAMLNMVADVALERETAVGLKLKAAEVWLRATGVMSQSTRSNSILDVVESEAGFADFSDSQLEVLRSQAVANQAELDAVHRARTVLASEGA